MEGVMANIEQIAVFEWRDFVALVAMPFFRILVLSGCHSYIAFKT